MEYRITTKYMEDFLKSMKNEGCLGVLLVDKHNKIIYLSFKEKEIESYLLLPRRELSEDEKLEMWKTKTFPYIFQEDGEFYLHLLNSKLGSEVLELEEIRLDKKNNKVSNKVDIEVYKRNKKNIKSKVNLNVWDALLLDDNNSQQEVVICGSVYRTENKHKYSTNNIYGFIGILPLEKDKKPRILYESQELYFIDNIIPIPGENPLEKIYLSLLYKDKEWKRQIALFENGEIIPLDIYLGKHLKDMKICYLGEEENGPVFLSASDTLALEIHSKGKNILISNEKNSKMNYKYIEIISRNEKEIRILCVGKGADSNIEYYILDSKEFIVKKEDHVKVSIKNQENNQIISTFNRALPIKDEEIHKAIISSPLFKAIPRKF